MTELEFNITLALAIGWEEHQMQDLRGTLYLEHYPDCWREFNYHDWNVISPIAERFDCFPRKDMYDQWIAGKYPYFVADTPQKAIALAVIGGLK